MARRRTHSSAQLSCTRWSRLIQYTTAPFPSPPPFPSYSMRTRRAFTAIIAAAIPSTLWEIRPIQFREWLSGERFSVLVHEKASKHLRGRRGLEYYSVSSLYPRRNNQTTCWSPLNFPRTSG
eukprot:COSAG02_NODE_1004_length_15275_cov_11.955917_9_plen_122_part_00